MNTPPLSLAFDIGHSSIGWAVLQPPVQRELEPQLMGCGVVLFPADECLASARAGFRRQRRHIAATRNRIKRLKTLLNHLGVVSEAQLNQHPSPYSSPWLFAARVLVSNGKQTLSWPELWAVLRWYAHNRGYDGNAAWAKDAAEVKENSDKEKNANGLMDKYGKGTMAETVCADLGIEPLSGKTSSTKYFKGNNAAFPRRVVIAEVRRLLEAHRDKLPKLSDSFIATLLDNWKALPSPIKLPQRYRGGLLFGQMIPRFDNRIIPTCRVTGEKTPLKHCRAFYRYRWAMVVNKLSVADPVSRIQRPLDPTERQKLHSQMILAGAFTKNQLKVLLSEITKADPSPLDQTYLNQEIEKELVFDPVMEQISKNHLAPLWKLIPEKFKKIFAGRLFHRRSTTLAAWDAELKNKRETPAGWQQALEVAASEKRNSKRKKNRDEYTFEKFLDDPIEIQTASGRAPYTRKRMEEAFDIVFSDNQAKNDPKAKGGPLEETDDVLDRRLEQPIAQQTNNHLVRHRLLILERTLADLVKKYADNDAKCIDKVTIEVVRDLQTFSGKTNYEIKEILQGQVGHHQSIVKKLKDACLECPKPFRINSSLIKKARIADDLDWQCPFTPMIFSIADLLPTGHADREHIIPRSLRPSDSLESLVITHNAVNKMKGKRTALQFMKECDGQDVPGTNVQLRPLNNYLAFVNNLEPKSDPVALARARGKRVSDDDLRKWKRKQLLLLEKYDPRDADFTGRDLTQTGHLVKLANLQAQAWFKKQDAEPRVEPLNGSVTGATRKSWKIMGCLAKACPRILDEAGEPRIKTEIREITHLHHAVDAVVLAFAAHFLPRDGNIWAVLNRRSVNDFERKLLESTGQFTFAEGNRPRMNDLPNSLKQQIAERLAEKRVVQHLPRKMSGLHIEETMWGIRNIRENGKIEIQQRKVIGKRLDGTRIFKKNQKPVLESKNKLWGYESPINGKLKRLNAVFVIKDNFGVALLDFEPIVLRHADVWKQVQELKRMQGSRKISYLRPGHTVTVRNGIYSGIWRVRQIIGRPRGISLQISHVDSVRADDPISSREALLKTLLRDGMTVPDFSYIGTL